MQKNILVTGADGQLGSEIKILASHYPKFHFLFTDYKELDLTSEQAVTNFFSKNTVSFIVNCAAYTAVDKAETEVESAYKVNSSAVEYLGKMSEKYDCPIVHVSTDYVFEGKDGRKSLDESDKVNPISVYGKSKLAGEQQLINVKKHIIIRTSWLYSEFGNNFLKTMIRLGNEKEKLNVIFDQIGSPTYAKDLADTILKIISLNSESFDDEKSGVYHFSNEGVASWYDFAYEIKRMTGFKAEVFPIETKDYPTPAERPRYSVLNKQKIRDTFSLSIRHWKDALTECISRL